jgi:hypothetical protein
MNAKSASAAAPAASGPSTSGDAKPARSAVLTP